MDVPLELSFRNMDSSEAVAERVRERVEKLEQHFGRISSCRVVVEAPHRRQHKGRIYHVRIEIGVPGREHLVVNRDPGQHLAHEDVFVAVRDAFNAAQRQLKNHARKSAGKVKAHEAPLHGKVSALHAFEGYGFVTLSDGQEVYFHQNAVLNGGFDKLALGDEVRVAMVEGESEKGPQATTITPIGKHHIVD